MKKLSDQKGFAVLEVILVVLVVVVAGGIGFWTVSKNKTNRSSNNIPQKPSSTVKSELSSSELGTIKGTEKLTSIEIEDDQKAEEDYSNKEQDNAVSDSSAINKTSEGYDVSL